MISCCFKIFNRKYLIHVISKYLTEIEVFSTKLIRMWVTLFINLKLKPQTSRFARCIISMTIMVHVHMRYLRKITAVT